jgi:hypothetical protein
LNTWFKINDLSAINVSGVGFDAFAFDVEFVETSVVQYCDAALLGLEHVNQHFLTHGYSPLGVLGPLDASE